MKLSLTLVPVLSLALGALAGPFEQDGHSLLKRHCEDQGLEYSSEVDACIGISGDDQSTVSADEAEKNCDPTDDNDQYSTDKSAWEYCWEKNLNYNPRTQKCYNPARHPSEYNCMWLGLNYDWETKQCTCKDWPEQPDSSSNAKYCYDKGLNYDPKTEKCYNPARHPSQYNCEWLGLEYDAEENWCYNPHKPYPPPPKPCKYCKSSWDCDKGYTCYYGKCKKQYW